MAWSEAQLEAITKRGCNILVAAAAGSGKTSVLVERIIRRLLDEEAPLDVDRLLVVTFTSAAAAEMRERIGAALQEKLQQSGASPQIERQLALLGSSSISTLHGFCQSVIRQHFHLLDLDPAFRVGSEAEMALLRQDALEELCADKYEAGDESFLQLVEHYGGERDDAQLYELVLGLYEFSRSHAWPEKWLAALPCAFDVSGCAGVDDTPWGGLLREKMKLELSALIEATVSLAGEAHLPEEYVRTLETDAEMLGGLAERFASWNEAEQGLKEVSFARLKSVKDADEAAKKAVQNQRKRCKDKIDEWKSQFFARSQQELLSDLTLVAPQVAALTALVQDFADLFASLKRERSLVDFSDLEHLCLAVLRDAKAVPGNDLPSPAALLLQEKYAEVMVDEYQDTNGVQEAILQLLLRRDAPNLFAVGDVKQSIYRFRLAEPELFLDKYRTYPQSTDACRIDLAQNFRSRDGILAAVNQVFAQVLTPAVTELEYGPEEQLNPGASYPEPPGLGLAGPVEVLLLEKTPEASDDEEGESGFVLEARAIAKRILQLMAEERWVFDKDSKTYRPLAWRDIVILLRSVRGKVETLEEVLQEAGIPLYADQPGGYFAETEVRVMLALLSCIDNPRQDIALAAALRSPLFAFNDAELAAIRLEKSQDDLWAAFLAAGEKDDELGLKIRAAKERFAAWRDLARRQGVPDLIWQIFRDTGYYDFVAGMPGGALRQANLRALYDRARQYEATNFRGLFRFLRFIERMQEGGGDLAVARTLGESEDVVRVMSIHKSKGLEFPVVIVADLGKAFNLGDARQAVLRHKKLGLGPYVTQPELRYRYPNLARLAIAHKLVLETKAEELRILYVAMTRAREKLIMTGAVKKLADRLDVWSRQGRQPGLLLSAGVLAGANCFMDWLGPVLSRRCASLKPFADQHWQLLLPDSAAKTETEAATTAKDYLAALKEGAEMLPGGFAAEVAAALEWTYPQAEVVDKPAKLSVTEIKRRFDSEAAEGAKKLFAQPSAAKRPAFIRAVRKMTPVEYGILMHGVMQNLQLAKKLDRSAIEAQVREMKERQLLSEEQLVTLDLDGVAAFFAAPLGRRMLEAPRVERELPFSVVLPAKRFYPELTDGEETIFVQGVVDALLVEEDGLVLIDYKTDHGLGGDALRDKYALQLSLYAEAIAGILRRPVKETYVYSFAGREVVRCC